MDAASHANRLARLLAVLQKGLGHELPNRLVAVQGLARLLEAEEVERLGADGRDYLRRLGAAADRAHALAAALADVARLARPPAAVEKADLADVVAEAIAEAKQLAAPTPPEYHASIPALALSVHGPALSRVLVRLLKHAGVARVDVSAGPAPAGAAIRIAGDRPAVPPEQAVRLFEPFAGAEDEGLDLFLARELAEGWGGSVVLESGGGAGTAFVVTCPLSHVPCPS
jgi:signal transduction histidine kinase